MFFREMIGEEFIQWKEGQVIIIETPTGSGKSTFFETVFKDYCLLLGKRILFLTNRILLREQMIRRQDRRIWAQAMEERPLWQHYWKSEDGNFVIATYQEVESAFLYHNVQKMNYYSSFDVAIADECHYFITDANFNTNTIVSFGFLLSTYRNRQLIFLSATMENFYGILIDYINRSTYASDLFVEGMYPAFKHYQFVSDYSGIEFDWIYKTADIASKISDLPENYKILIFVSTIKEGNEIRSLLRRIVPSSQICMLNSRTVHTEKGAEIADELVENQKFSTRILIATALIDTGVNIIDEDVKAIFLFQNNQEAAIQMLGRRRRMLNEQLYVCLHARSDTYFRKKYERIDYELNYINRICKKQEFAPEYFDVIVGKDFFDVEKQKVLSKFIGMNMYPRARQRYFVNILSCLRMKQLSEEYKAIYNDFQKMGMDAFLFRQGKCWFGIHPETLKFSKPLTYLESICEVFRNFLNSRLNIAEFDEFRVLLMPLLHREDRDMFPKMTELAKWQKINLFLAKNKLPFVILMHPKKNNCERGYEIKIVEGGLIYEPEEI